MPLPLALPLVAGGIALGSRALFSLVKGSRHMNRAFKWLKQGVGSPVGRTTGAKSMKVQGPIKEIATKKGNKLSMETFGAGGAKGNTFISSSDAASLTGKAMKIQAVRNTGVAATAVGGGLLGLDSIREKPSTARDIKERKARNAPLEQKKAQPLSQEKKKGKKEGKKEGKTPFQKWFAIQDKTNPGTVQTWSKEQGGTGKKYLITHDKKKLSPGLSSSAMIAQGGMGGSSELEDKHGTGYVENRNKARQSNFVDKFNSQRYKGESGYYDSYYEEKEQQGPKGPAVKPVTPQEIWDTMGYITEDQRRQKAYNMRDMPEDHEPLNEVFFSSTGKKKKVKHATGKSQWLGY